MPHRSFLLLYSQRKAIRLMQIALMLGTFLVLLGNIAIGEEMQGRSFEQQYAIYKSMNLRLSKMTHSERETWQPTEEERLAYATMQERIQIDGRVLFRQVTSAPPGKHGLKESEVTVAFGYYQDQFNYFGELLKRLVALTVNERKAVLETKAAKDGLEAFVQMRSWESKYGTEKRKREIAAQYEELIAIAKGSIADIDARIAERQREADFQRQQEPLPIAPFLLQPPPLIVMPPMIQPLPLPSPPTITPPRQPMNCTSSKVGNQVYTNCY